MLLKQIIDVFELLDDSRVDGAAVIDFLKAIDPEVDAETYPLTGPRGTTHMVKVRIPGARGKSAGGTVPTLGILGRLGARPEMIGYVSDGDGALAALAIVAKLLDMKKKGDVLPGDIFISTHICPDAPTSPHGTAPLGHPAKKVSICKALRRRKYYGSSTRHGSNRTLLQDKLFKIRRNCSIKKSSFPKSEVSTGKSRTFPKWALIFRQTRKIPYH